MSEDITSVPESSDTEHKGPRGTIPDPPALDPEPIPERSMLVIPSSREEFNNRRQRSSQSDAKDQSQLLEMLARFFPNVSRACMLAGVSTRVYRKWLAEDEDFRNEVELIREQLADTLEAHGVNAAMKAGGFMYWISTLKHLRPEKWNVGRGTLSPMRDDRPEEIEHRRANLERVIAADAEVIQATTGHAAPTIPHAKAPEPEYDVIPSLEDDVIITPAQEAPNNPTGGDHTVSTTDDVAPLDNGGDFCKTHAVDDLDISGFTGRGPGKNLPRKKPNPPDNSPAGAPPLSPQKREGAL